VVGLELTDTLATQLSVELRGLGYTPMFGTWDAALRSTAQPLTVVRVLPGDEWVELWLLDNQQGELRRRGTRQLQEDDSPRIQALKIAELIRAEHRQRESEPRATRNQISGAAEAPARATSPPKAPSATPFRPSLAVLGGVQAPSVDALVPTVGLWGGASRGPWHLGLIARHGFAEPLTVAQVSARELSLHAVARLALPLAQATFLAFSLELGGGLALVDANLGGVARETYAVSPSLVPGVWLLQGLGHSLSLLGGVRGEWIGYETEVKAGSQTIYESGRFRLGAELGLQLEF
jgi:hypothetical protein